MHRFAVLLLVLTLILISARTAAAETCTIRPIFSEIRFAEINSSTSQPCRVTSPSVPILQGKVVGAGIIYLYANDEAHYSSLNNVLHAIQQLEGTRIQPGETFSFNKAAHLLQETIPYDLGPDVHDNMVKAGGVCMVSTMIATAAHDAGLPFEDDRGKIIPVPVPHSRFYKYYHQVNMINNHPVAITEAAIAIRKDELGQPWRTVQDMQFINNTGRVLVLHFNASFNVNDLDLSQPLGLIQQDHSLEVELRAVPNGLDAWIQRLTHLTLN